MKKTKYILLLLKQIGMSILKKFSFKYKWSKYIWQIIIFWTLVVFVSSFWNIANMYKTTIHDVKLQASVALDKVLSMEPIYYSWLETLYDEDGNISVGGLLDGGRDIGFIAQDMINIVPEAVSSPEDETKKMWGIDYGKLAPIIVKTIQEQQKLIENLQQGNSNLKAEFEAKIQELMETISR